MWVAKDLCLLHIDPETTSPACDGKVVQTYFYVLHVFRYQGYFISESQVVQATAIYRYTYVIPIKVSEDVLETGCEQLGRDCVSLANTLTNRDVIAFLV